MALAIGAALAGGGAIPIEGDFDRPITIGLDWFVLNLLLLALVFVPLERAFPHRARQTTFRFRWTTDGTHFLVSHLALQVLTFMTLLPSTMLAGLWQPDALRSMIGGQPTWLQFLATVVLTDLVQYWVHRAFHHIPILWRFHAVFIHANVGFDFGVVDHWIGTLHLPERVWPEAYGIDGHPIPEGWMAQLVNPYRAALARKLT